LDILATVLEFLKTVNLEDEDIDGNIIRPEKNTLKNIKELLKNIRTNPDILLNISSEIRTFQDI
jgi:hypothetical protein